MRSKGVDRLKKGDIVRIVTPGGGGYGNPSDRSSEAIAKDLGSGKITQKFAKKNYGSKVTNAALALLHSNADTP